MMFAEKLLFAKGMTMPTRERDVLHALDTLREPPGIVKRRQARTIYMSSSPPEVATESSWRGIAEYFNDPARARAAGVPLELRKYLGREIEPVISDEVEVFTKALICTGAIYRLDGGEEGTQGVLDSIWGGLPIGELPPLPYPRIWIEARAKNGEYVPLWKGNPPEGAWNALDTGALWGMGINEIVTGQSWGIIAVRQDDWTYTATEGYLPGILSSPRYERISATDLRLTPEAADDLFVMTGANIHDDPAEDKMTAGVMMRSEAAYRGAMAAWALVLADIITARNVDRREEVMSRRWHKQLQRRAPGGRFAPRLYNVSLATATDDPKDETHRSLSVRFLVRGHWRVSTSEHSRWVESKEAFCIWVHAHVKGPPGAPWKGRPVYVEPPHATVDTREEKHEQGQGSTSE